MPTTELDIRLLYHKDTGLYPIRRDESSLRGELDFLRPFECEDVEDEDMEEISSFMADESELSKKELTKKHEQEKLILERELRAEANNEAEDLIEYVKWLETQLIQSHDAFDALSLKLKELVKKSLKLQELFKSK